MALSLAWSLSFSSTFSFGHAYPFFLPSWCQSLWISSMNRTRFGRPASAIFVDIVPGSFAW